MVKLIGNEVSISVVQWSESLCEQCALCTVITRRYIDHIRIIVHVTISCIILLYTPVFLFRSIIYKAARFVSDKTASGNLRLT
jgi:hypothetical protein